MRIRRKTGVSLFLRTASGSRKNKGRRSEKYESVGIMWTSDDARLPGQFVIMTGTADRVHTTRNHSSCAGVKHRVYLNFYHLYACSNSNHRDYRVMPAFIALGSTTNPVRVHFPRFYLFILDVLFVVFFQANKTLKLLLGN